MIANVWHWFYPKFKWINDHASGIKTLFWMASVVVALAAGLAYTVLDYLSDGTQTKLKQADPVQFDRFLLDPRKVDQKPKKFRESDHSRQIFLVD